MASLSVSLLKAIGGPGSIGFLALCSVLGLLLGRIGPRARRVGRIWLLCVFVGYIFLGLPVVANGIAARLTTYRPVSDLAQLGGTDVVVVLDGDNVLGRVREARRIFDALSPRWVVVSGRPWLVEQLVEAGIPSDRIVTDFQSPTTLAQLHELPGLLDGRSAGRIVLIASRLQMPRVAALARAQGLAAAFAPSPIDDEPPRSGIRLLVPTYTALRVSRDAIYEHLALAYYRQRRWIQ